MFKRNTKNIDKAEKPNALLSFDDKVWGEISKEINIVVITGIAKPPHKGMPPPPFKKKSVKPMRMEFLITDAPRKLTLIMANITRGSAVTMENLVASAIIQAWSR